MSRGVGATFSWLLEAGDERGDHEFIEPLVELGLVEFIGGKLLRAWRRRERRTGGHGRGQEGREGEIVEHFVEGLLFSLCPGTARLFNSSPGGIEAVMRGRGQYWAGFLTMLHIREEWSR